MAFANPLGHPLQAGIDGGIAAIIVSSFVGLIPAIAGLLGIIYYAIQVWESKTVQGWVLHHKQRRAIKNLAKLQAKQKVILAQIAAAELVRRASAVADNKVERAKADAATIVAQATDPNAAPPDQPAL